MAKKTKIAGSAGPLFDHAAVTGQDAVTYAKSATTSWEQIFSPLTIRKGLVGTPPTPGFRPPQSTSELGPFGGSAVGPTVRELDPYFSVIIGGDGTGFFQNTDYRFVTTDNGGSNGAGISANSLNKDEIQDSSSVSTVRTNALRGPLILSGWGFGIDDLPVPAVGNDWPDKATFHKDVAGNRAQWKTGPVNLMWDDERQVWQGGYHVVCGVTTNENGLGSITAPRSPCDPTKFQVKIFRNTGHIGGRLSTTLGETITMANRDPSLEQSFEEGAVFVIAIRINYEWIPLWVGCPDGPATSDCVV